MHKTFQSGSARPTGSFDISRSASIGLSRSPARVQDNLAIGQSTWGNQSIQRLLSGGVLQKKLTINRPGDVYEREADKVADAVMGMPDRAATSERVSQGGPAAGLQRCACSQPAGGSVESEQRIPAMRLQRSSEGSSGIALAPPLVHDVLRSSGDRLDVGTRSFMEPRFGYDFSAVRIHTDARAAESAEAVGALAYTVGQDVVFGHGQYIPGTQVGRKLLAHELAHTVQQKHTRAAGIQRHKVEDCDPRKNPLEQPSTVHDAHRRGMDMLNNAISRSANAADPAVQSAAQTHFKIALPAPDSFTQYLWARAKQALGTMTAADANAVYECEPKQNWWNGGCIKNNVAVSLFNIHLCPLWWSGYPDLDCRASVLVHEWGHKWGKGVNRVFESYAWQPKFQRMGAKDRVKMPDAYAGYAYELYTGNPWRCG
jgi:Domain of unknown function (DUF4157)